MQFSATVAAAALVAGAAAGYSNETVYTTEVVTAYTTYCPAPTTITHGSNTYTVTEATTLTISDCPCTISKPVYSSGPAPTEEVPAPTGEAPAPSAPAPYPTGNATVPANPSAPAGTAPGAPGSTGEVPSGTAPAGENPSAPVETGAAARAFAPAGLAGLVGLAAYLL